MRQRAAWIGRALAAVLAPVVLACAAWAQPLAAEGLPQDAAEYLVQPRDTLIGISRRLLADPTGWRVVARFNGLRNPHQIRPGMTIRLPLALLHSEVAPATVLAASGSVRRSDRPDAPQAGDVVPEGSTLGTGSDGTLVVRLVDGTVLRLRANSELLVRDARRYPAVEQTRSSVQLRQGRVDVDAAPSKGGQPGFRVITPQGVLAVRGTEFRVAAQAMQQLTFGEVLEGAVVVGGRGEAVQRLDAGFGTRVDATGRVEAPVPLLAAPTLHALPTLQERPLVVFDFPSVAGAASYRAQVARDASFDAVVDELVVPAPPLRIAGLADGEYVLRLRATDGAGLEGRNAELRFTLKARPEPPLPRQPGPRARLRGPVDFAWAANAQARSYRWQLAGDAAFTTVLHERLGLRELVLQLPELAPGRYFWRLASERTDDDTGPWGDALGFEVLVTPPPPPPGSRVDDEGVSLSWVAQPGQSFDLEIARDEDFAQPVVSAHLREPAYNFVAPAPGRWFLRLRARESDGFIGPWGSTQFVGVPDCLRSASGSCWRAGGEPVLRLP